MEEATIRPTIILRDGSGQPISIYPHNSTLAACIALSINYSKGYFKLREVDDDLLRLVWEHTEFDPNAWYKDTKHGSRTAEDVKNHFFDNIFVRFCMLAVDHTITKPDCLGGRVKQEWYRYFAAENYCILLNASRVNDMVAAYERVVSSHHTDNDEKNLRTFLFNFANTFFREICSLFVTYLTKDRTVMISQSVHRILDKDEFSRRMENVLFGGTIMYYPDPFLDASQSGIPFVITKHGARKVSLGTIYARTENDNIDKWVPIKLEGPFIDPDLKETMGQHLPPVTLTNPMDWPVMRQFKEAGT